MGLVREEERRDGWRAAERMEGREGREVRGDRKKEKGMEAEKRRGGRSLESRARRKE